MSLSLVVAVSQNGVIGGENTLLWKLPADMRHFVEKTKGKPVVMGRKTHESIGHALPGRTNIVITRQKGYSADGCIVVPSLPLAIDAAKREKPKEICVIGGGEVYREALPLADTIHFTRVHGNFEGDTTFPELDPMVWTETWREAHPADAENPYPYTFITYEKRRIA